MKNQKITLVHTLYSIGFFTVFFGIGFVGGFPFQEVLMAGAIFSSSFYLILGVKKLRRLIYGKG